jgi:hypothetical protein
VTILGSHDIVSGQEVALKNITQGNGYSVAFQVIKWLLFYPITRFQFLGILLVVTVYVPATDVDAVVSNNFKADGTTPVENKLKVNRSNVAFNILFWGEVVKVMTVSNNQISISMV